MRLRFRRLRKLSLMKTCDIGAQGVMGFRSRAPHRTPTNVCRHRHQVDDRTSCQLLGSSQRLTHRARRPLRVRSRHPPDDHRCQLTPQSGRRAIVLRSPLMPGPGSSSAAKHPHFYGRSSKLLQRLRGKRELVRLAKRRNYGVTPTERLLEYVAQKQLSRTAVD